MKSSMVQSQIIQPYNYSQIQQPIYQDLYSPQHQQLMPNIQNSAYQQQQYNYYTDGAINMLNSSPVTAKKSQSQQKSHSNLPGIPYNKTYNATSQNHSRLHESVISRKPLIDSHDPAYRDSIFGLGMSNIHSSSSLRHSVPQQALIYDRRFKFNPYQGYDPLKWNPQSIFTSKEQVKQTTMRSGMGMVKGDSLTQQQRVDFTDPYKYYPGPGQYQPPLLKDKLAQKLQYRKWKREQDRRQQLGLISQKPY